MGLAWEVEPGDRVGSGAYGEDMWWSWHVSWVCGG